MKETVKPKFRLGKHDRTPNRADVVAFARTLQSPRRRYNFRKREEFPRARVYFPINFHRRRLSMVTFDTPDRLVKYRRRREPCVRGRAQVERGVPGLLFVPGRDARRRFMWKNTEIDVCASRMAQN